MAVCPAGEDVIGPFLDDRKGFLEEVVNPLQEKEEPVYVVPGSDAEAYVAKRFPHKTDQAGRQRAAAHDRSASFLRTLPHVFQRHRSEGLAATYHFTFTGEEPADGDGRDPGQDDPGRGGARRHARPARRADSRTWLGFLRKERSLVWALLRRKIRLKGSPRLLLAFGSASRPEHARSRHFH